MAENKDGPGRFRSDVRKDLFDSSFRISKEMDAWLVNLGSAIKQAGGYKMPKSYIVRSLLDVAMCLKIDVTGVKTEKELSKRILKAISNYKG